MVRLTKKEKEKVCVDGYEIADEAAADQDGRYKLKNRAGLYRRGGFDPATGIPGNKYGELIIEYGSGEHKKTVTYTGNIANGVIDGKGRMDWPCGTSYRGQFKNGCRHGRGILIMPDGLIKEKEYRNGAEVNR